ncbi:MAG: LptF/LptG family permease [Sphaerochaetaceae bacterium]|nr:LptF/LptG family permease [Sphaerochaetaceae bacterium]MDD3163453.1 LptF/LptG family permease [Sphaerochaetaceae bacterium]
MKKGKRSFGLLYTYVAREYFLSFLVSFLFFFFIFFVNQILVLAKEILLKNVSVRTVLYLVVLTIPQFLLYTFPFSSLTAASMAIGDLSSKNEILAMRFSGIHIRNLFIPIVAVSLLLSLGTILISNNLVPYTAMKYKEEYTKILADLPAIEIESYKVNNINNLVLSNGEVEGSVIHDLTIFDSRATDNANAIASEKGEIKLIDLSRFTYELTLDNPQVLTTYGAGIDEWGLASAGKMKIFLDFSNLIPSVQNITPSQMSLSQLSEKTSEKEKERVENQLSEASSNSIVLQNYSSDLHQIQMGTADSDLTASSLELQAASSKTLTSKHQVNFYLQYYKSEYNKKLALSLACTFLVFAAFPISFFKIRYGRLIGFAISIFVAVVYWFFIFFMQLKAVETYIDPVWLMWIPDIVFFLIGIVLVGRLSKQ